MRNLEDRSFLLLVIAISLAFAWVVWPFFGAILWGTAMAIVFAPFNRRVTQAMPERRNLAAFLTLMTIMAIVILPALLIAAFLLQEAATFYARIESGELDLGLYLQDIQMALPPWATHMSERLGLANLTEIREKFSAGIVSGLQFLASHAVNFGQSAFGFAVGLGVMLYLTFFLLRDGDSLSRVIINAVPLRPEQQHALISKFAVVIRATIKGSLVVAILQGAIGGLIFWALGIHTPLLWAVLMAFMSLLPAVGTGLVWVPVAIYLLATGAIWQGVVMTLCGIFIIGLVDNLLRPVLVGKDARIPDYIVLISTLGGIEIFGFNGFVIGPVIAALFMAVWDIFTDVRRKADITPGS